MVIASAPIAITVVATGINACLSASEASRMNRRFGRIPSNANRESINSYYWRFQPVEQARPLRKADGRSPDKQVNIANIALQFAMISDRDLSLLAFPQFAAEN